MTGQYPRDDAYDDPYHTREMHKGNVPFSKTAKGDLTELVPKDGQRGRYSRKRKNGPTPKQKHPDKRTREYKNKYKQAQQKQRKQEEAE